jgi:mannose-1-phosphate guanylyltransferase
MTLPKQFCTFRGDRSLLQSTMYRVLPLVPPRHCVVVVAAEHRPTAEEQLRGFRGVVILDQPVDRGTAAGVLLPLSHVLEAEPNARVLLLPSDHAFADEGLFVRGIDEADRAIDRRVASVVLFGVAADAPHGDYGWIGAGQPLDGPGSRLRRVTSFREKPGQDAERLWEGGALWNTMILLARGRALRALFTRHLPELGAAFRAHGMLPREERAAFLADTYLRLRPADFSRDLVGRAEGLAVYGWPGGIGWTDLGTPQRVRDWLGCRALGGAHEPGRRTDAGPACGPAPRAQLLP